MFLVRGFHGSISDWRHDPLRMVAQLATSTIVGQALFWRVGYDQLGVAMNPKREFGAGIDLADKVASRIPNTAGIAWAIKVLEILADLGKMPIEGRAYSQYGIAPDVVACAITQPLWSGIESVEKTVGVLIHPERVNTPEQIRLSLACIYGSLVRYGLGIFVIIAGRQINRWLTEPIERSLKTVFKRR